MCKDLYLICCPLCCPLVSSHKYRYMGYSLNNNIREDKIKTNGECPVVIRVTINRKSYRRAD